MRKKEAEGEPRLIPEVDQPSLEQAAGGTEAGVAPAEGTAYEEMKGDIEKDIREWKKAEGGRGRRDREEQKKRTPPFWKKKGKKD
jgi:hypothetical protein